MNMDIKTQHWIDVLAVIEGMLFGLEANEGSSFNHETPMVRGASSLIYQAIEHFQSLNDDEEQESDTGQAA